jgi:hypothetical protein
MTDRVEIKPDGNEKTLEQSAEDLKKDGVDVSKDVAVNANGETAKLTEIKNKDLQTTSKDEVRPDWLPEKFKSAEELAKAYTGLEKEFSSRTKEEVKPTEEVQEVQDKGLDKYYSEFAEKGELTDNSYTELAKQGLDKGLVDEYIRGQKAIAETQTTQVYETVGGQEKYSELISWAGNNLSEGEQTAFNDLTATGSIDQIKLAVQGLMTKAGMTNQPQQEMIQGDVNNTAVEQFNSVQQVTEAMNDPRYDKDPVYRKEVERKLGNSSVF